MWLGLAFALAWLHVLGHSLHMLFALIAVSLSQCQADMLATGCKSSVRSLSSPKQNWKFLHQANVGVPILLLLMAVHLFWKSDCPDGDAGNTANPYKLIVRHMCNRTK